jgi:hypothetical protein
MSRRNDRRRSHAARRNPAGLVYLNAISRAIEGARKLPAESVNSTVAGVEGALLAFRRGEDCLNHWRCLVDALNVAEVLAELNICSLPENIDAIRHGLGTLALLHDQHTLIGSWTMRAPDVAAVDAALTIHAIQLQHCSLTEYERAISTVRRRAQQALAGNAAPGTRVLTGDIA